MVRLIFVSIEVLGFFESVERRIFRDKKIIV